MFGDLDAKPGPRMIRDKGSIAVTCENGKSTIEAMVPTSAEIHGASNVAAHTLTQYSAVLMADKTPLDGSTRVEWRMVKCDDYVMLAPGDSETTRKLTAANPGTCELDATLTVGGDGAPTKSWEAQTLVTIEAARDTIE